MAVLSSNEIRLLRHSRQVKQEDVARKMGITKQRYSELENHKDLRTERVSEILAMLGYTMETARKFLDNIPPPKKKSFEILILF